MNRWWSLHPLALFCHVARHGGISAALPHIGYSLQQPALSKQMIELEDLLRHRLFERQPFRLLPAGEHVYAAVAPMLDAMNRALDDLVGGAGPLLRVEAPVTVLSHFLPEIVAELRRTDTATRVELLPLQTAGTAAEAVAAGQLDLVIATEPCARVDVVSTRLLSLTPALLAQPGYRLPPLARLVARQTLVSSRASAALGREFARALEAQGLVWKPQFVVGSMLEVASFVAGGHGIGLGFDLPRLFSGLSIHPLRDLNPIDVVMIHRPRPCPRTLALAAAARAAGARLQSAQGRRGKRRR